MAVVEHTWLLLELLTVNVVLEDSGLTKYGSIYNYLRMSIMCSVMAVHTIR